MKKILIVETNTSKYANHNLATGLWFGELTHFYNFMVKAGYDIDFMSPKGGYVPIDPYSMKFANDIDYELLVDDDFIEKALASTKKPSDINPEEYIAIYYTGGHGVLWDFPDNIEIQDIAMKIYENGGYISSVCHGVVGLLNIKDNNGDYLIKDKNITGFTNTEELISGRLNKVPFSTEKALKNRTCNYHKRRFFKSFAIRDGRIITGQNPWSPKAVAELLAEALER